MSEEQIAKNTDVKNELELEQRAKSGAYWFYWIAGLSIINSIVLMAGATINFPVGLAVTQIVDGFVFEAGAGAQLVGLVFNLIVGAVFVFFGVMSRKGQEWAFISGMIFYGADALLFLMVQDWLSIGFHVWGFMGMLAGLKATGQLRKLALNPTTATPHTPPVGDHQTHDYAV